VRPAGVRDHADAGKKIHGDHLDLPPARSRVEEVPAARFLIDAFTDGSDITLVPTGPLTNIATALLLDPGLAARIPRLVLMGGGHVRANATASAEFNIWADPEAARIVLRSGIREIVVVPLDATHEALVTEADCERLAALGTPAGTAAAPIIRHRIQGYAAVQPPAIPNSAPVHDALCVAHLIEPDVIITREAHVDVELSGELTRGRTVVDLRPIPALPPNARWAYGANRERFLELLLAAFA
jgi:purine nucleosidase/ribosylpyrimidine nucleosidase